MVLDTIVTASSDFRLTPATTAQAPSEAQHSVAREEEERHMAVAPHERRSEAIQVLF